MQVLAVDLAHMLVDARKQTLRLIEDLSDEQLLGPRLAIINPLLWEIGHVAWFQEKWLLRHLRHEEPIWKPADELYDSAGIPHDVRWNLPLPSRSQTLAYMQSVLDRALNSIKQREPGPQEFYFYHLAAFHEDMHDEAFVYTRQTLGYAPPSSAGPSANRSAGAASAGQTLKEDVEFPGGRFLLGATPGTPFVFDNEKWAHEVALAAFAMSRTKVSNGEFLRFVEDRGYERPEFWSQAGWKWREVIQARHPVYWIGGSGGRWSSQSYDRIIPLTLALPVIHINWYEAEAYCRWAKRRLPTEAEWELAASAQPAGDGKTLAPGKRTYPWGDELPDPNRAHLDLTAASCISVDALPAGDSAFGCRQMIGNAWEWTASDFEPYPGFSPDPYKEYSQPWFGDTHKVLRGGAFATRCRLIRTTYRNFYTPDRRDVLAGFRTCRL